MRLVGFLLLALEGCAGTLAAVDVAGVQDSATLSAMAYAREDASSPTAALSRGAYCASAGVLRRADASVDVDTSIRCP